MIRTLVLAAGLAIGASSAQAAFVWIEAVEGDSAAAAAFAGAGAITFQIFATFDAAGDGSINTVLSTGFANFGPAGGGTFFNVPAASGGSITPPSSFGVSVVPALAFDTYGTIGANRSDDPGGAGIAPDPSAAITDTHIGGGWFNSNPPSNVGAAVANSALSTGFGTLLWNITISNPDPGANVANLFTLITFPYMSIFEQVPGGALEHPIFPAPGSMGLFGIAGLAALRRRRR